MIDIKPADKILNLPKYIFSELDEWKDEMRAKGIDLIDLGIGNPDGATPQPVVEAAIRSVQNPINHGYPSFRGKKEFRQAITKWLKNRYNVNICPEYGVQTLIGAKEGIAHAALAFTNPGDINIVPDPYYPVLSRGTWISSAEVYHTPLLKENNFLPDLKAIPEEIAQKAKMFFINYPNNPTGAIAPKEFLEEIVEFCRKYSILLVSDLAYGEVCYDNYRPLSIFNIKNAFDVAVEFHTLSKSFNMAGWRAGFVIGKKEFVDAIYAMKSNIDYGTSSMVQDASIAALEMDYSHVQNIMNKYSKRRKIVETNMEELGWEKNHITATMYYWYKVPNGYKSKEFCKMVLEKTGVVFTPGIAFGNYSDNYFRLSLVQPDNKLQEAFERLKKANIKFK